MFHYFQTNFTVIITLIVVIAWVVAVSGKDNVKVTATRNEIRPLKVPLQNHHRMVKTKKRIAISTTPSTTRTTKDNSTTSSARIMNASLPSGTPPTPSRPSTWFRDDGAWNPVPGTKPITHGPVYQQTYDPIDNPPYYHNAEQESQPNQIISYQIPQKSYSTSWSPYHPYHFPTGSSPTHFRRDASNYGNPNQEFVPAMKKVCDGKKNLIDDFGIISLILSIFSTFVGFGLDLILSLKGGALAIIAKFFGLLFSLPSSLLTALNVSNPISYLFSNGLNVLSIATTLIGAGGGVSIGNLGLATDVIFEILGIYGLVLSVFSTFPDLFDEVVDAAYLFGWGTQVKAFIEGYGCQNPYLDPTT